MAIRTTRKREPGVYLPRGKAAGQSIPLIALMIVLLIGLVALSVDVGNTYAQQRQVVRATNAASTVAMMRYIENGTDTDISRSIEESFRSNGIDPVRMESIERADLDEGQRRWEAYYLDYAGIRMGGGCRVGACGQAPSGVEYIEINSDGIVDTYFARVVGTNTLPVRTAAFASPCPPTVGVFPIAVSINAIGDTSATPPQFRTVGGVAPSRAYIQDLDRTFSMQRLYFGDDIFSFNKVTATFLRWKPDYTADDLAGMLAEDGNLDRGFEEVTPWPLSGIEETDNYPTSPRYLTNGDWAHGVTSSEVVDWGPLEDAFEFHKRERTQMILLIYQHVATTTDGEPSFYIARFAKFYLMRYGVEDNPDSENNGARYIDLAFHSLDPQVPCPANPVNVDGRVGLYGYFSVHGRYGIIPEDVKPSAYSVMLDVSGSMSWSFDGLGSWQGQDYQCESYQPDIPLPFANGPGGIGGCQGGSRAYWRIQEERRAYSSRHALLEAIDRMDPNDRVRLVAFNNGIRAQFNKWYEPDDPELRNEVLRIGEYSSGGSPSFLTTGGTNGPKAVERARSFIDNSLPKEETGPNAGRELRPVMMYMTDGVANRLRNGNGSPGRVECDEFNGNTRSNTSWCQYGYRNGQPLPIMDMVLQSRDMHAEQPDDFKFFVVAMGRVDTVGLDEVATNPSMLFSAKSEDQLNNFLGQIVNDIKYDQCIIKNVDQPITRISGAMEADRGVTDLPGGTYGYVRIFQDGVQIGRPLPIQHQDNGQLGFRLEPVQGLLPGTYQLQAYIMLNASGKGGPERVDLRHNYIKNPDTLQYQEELTFVVENQAFGRYQHVKGTLTEPNEPIELDVDPSFLTVDRIQDIFCPPPLSG